MLVKEILGNISDYPMEGKETDRFFLEWYELDKKLLRRASESGEEVGIRIDQRLHDGDVLYDDAGRVLVVEVLPCDLTRVKVHSMKEMGRLCFELGNRHLSVSIGENVVRVPYDRPTFEYLEKLGFAPEKVKEKFTDFTVCHAHGHSHEHSHEGGHVHSRLHEGAHMPEHSYESRYAHG
ncbi:MAG TPA: urease accessory protein UreE [Candidatus Mediterraneibacter cottocaccae]|nr:urease accessory protein UreE [Candidatus Mediterraneibacter cottocaccae]